MSRAHARVTRRGAGDFLEDLGSKQGTFVNERRIEQPTVLADGDCIEMGHSLFVYRRASPLTAVRLAGPSRGPFTAPPPPSVPS